LKPLQLDLGSSLQEVASNKKGIMSGATVDANPTNVAVEHKKIGM
jgi:hypothetical protein